MVGVMQSSSRAERVRTAEGKRPEVALHRQPTASMAGRPPRHAPSVNPHRIPARSGATSPTSAERRLKLRSLVFENLNATAAAEAQEQAELDRLEQSGAVKVSKERAQLPPVPDRVVNVVAQPGIIKAASREGFDTRMNAMANQYTQQLDAYKRDAEAYVRALIDQHAQQVTQYQQQLTQRAQQWAQAQQEWHQHTQQWNEAQQQVAHLSKQKHDLSLLNQQRTNDLIEEQQRNRDLRDTLKRERQVAVHNTQQLNSWIARAKETERTAQYHYNVAQQQQAYAKQLEAENAQLRAQLQALEAAAGARPAGSPTSTMSTSTPVSPGQR
ncbi:MAG TPA: hypothetical protein VLG71_02105 [Candidatus Limnocylindria bacterium]|nr:hypothetical protein [Candidatus Limnocylindria bacterium]